MPNGINDRKNGARGDMNTVDHDMMWGCRSCRGWGHGFFLFRVLVTVILIIVVFMAGVRFGELKAYVGADRYGDMMRTHQYYPTQQYMVSPEMNQAAPEAATSGADTVPPAL